MPSILWTQTPLYPPPSGAYRAFVVGLLVLFILAYSRLLYFFRRVNGRESFFGFNAKKIDYSFRKDFKNKIEPIKEKSEKFLIFYGKFYEK